MIIFIFILPYNITLKLLLFNIYQLIINHSIISNHDYPPTLNLHSTFARFSYSRLYSKLPSRASDQVPLFLPSLQIAHDSRILNLKISQMNHYLIHLFIPIYFQILTVLQANRITFGLLGKLVFFYCPLILGLGCAD